MRAVHRSLHVVLLCTLLGIALAGCVGAEDEAPEVGEDGAAPAKKAPDLKPIPDDKASVTGTVVSDDFLPLGGAEVVIQELDINTTTDADGRYVIELVAPGQYKMFAQADGFAVNVTSVVLKGGELNRASFILTTLPSQKPHITLLEQSGFIECAWGTPAVTGNCVPLQFLFDQLGTNPTGTVTILKWDFDSEGLQAIVVELVWDSPFDGTTAKELLLIVEADGSGPLAGEEYGQASGPSPVRIDLSGETLPKPDEGGTTGTFQTRVFPPFEAGHVAFQQKYTVFMSLFYYKLPGPGYTGIPDGF